MPGLLLTRKEGEKVQIGDDVTVTVMAKRGSTVRLLISAPPEIAILRPEAKVKHRKQKETKE